MIPELTTSLPSLVITVCLITGGLWVFRRAYVKQLGEMQERVIGTYKLENDALEREIKLLKRENVAMRTAFKHLGVEIEINGTTITITDRQQTRKRIVHVPPEEHKGEEET